MVAAHLACRSILLGECDAAIVVGVSDVAPASHRLFSWASRGRDAAFDETAIVILRGKVRRCPFAAVAIARRDHVFASIVASAIKSGRRTPAITPRPTEPAEKVIRMALRRMGGSPDDIGARRSARHRHTRGRSHRNARARECVWPRRSTPLLVGSVRATSGHLEAGAGLLGIVKAALSSTKSRSFRAFTSIG
jgi:acyl transferase domain-containing protein